MPAYKGGVRRRDAGGRGGNCGAGGALAIQGALPRVLKPGEKIYIGNILSTGKEARLEVKINDGTIFILGERSSFNVIDNNRLIT